jgi:hypothetical protein
MTISKTYSFDEQTQTETVVDDRIFSMCVDHQLQQIRSKAMELILTVAPDYKQRNAALGLLDPAEAQALKDEIQTIRTKSNGYEAAINSVAWDGQESTRPAACDAVQAVRWED